MRAAGDPAIVMYRTLIEVYDQHSSGFVLAIAKLLIVMSYTFSWDLMPIRRGIHQPTPAHELTLDPIARQLC